jgi:hypothetical protein
MKMEHHICGWYAPDSVTLRCDCGWHHRETRRQNALGRAAKERAAVSAHEREIAPAKVVTWLTRRR